MALVTLDLAIGHCRANPGEENELIQIYLDGAEQSALDYLNRQVFTDKAAMDAAVADGTAGEFPMVVNSAIKVAILKTTAEVYANREDSVVGATVVELPMSAKAFLRPHRIVPGV